MIDTNTKIIYVAGIVVALAISIGAGYFFVGQGEDYSAVDSTRRTSPQPATSTQEPAKANSQPAQPAESNAQPATAQFSPPPKQTGALTALDLSLGVLTIDDPEEKVRQALGAPLSTKPDGDLTRLKYDALEVVLRNGKVSALISQTAAVSTPRGIHDGSPAQKVFDEYGTDYESSSFENTTLYEYTATSKDGTPCWLRFAVRNDDSRVDYISVRFVQ